MTEQFIQLASGFGAPGFMIAFMVWDKMQQNALAQKRIDADLIVAKALTELVSEVRHVRQG